MLLCIKKLFMVFLHLQQGTGEAVANDILTLAEMFLMLATYMANHMTGLQQWLALTLVLRQEQLNLFALYTHCRSRVLNLSIASSYTEHGVCDMIQVINEVYLFLHHSPKRQRFLELVLDVYISEPHVKKIKGL